MLPKYFIIFDCEMTAWKDSLKYNWNRDFEEPELINCCAYKIENLNHDLKIIESFNYYIKPKINPILSEYIINLTNITQDNIDILGLDFIDFIEKFYKFSKYINKNYIDLNLYSYGQDYTEIERNLKLNHIKKNSKYYEWKKYFFDIRPIFQNFNIDTNKYSSGTIYNIIKNKINIKKKIETHKSDFDVYSMFITLQYFIKNKSLSNYKITCWSFI